MDTLQRSNPNIAVSSRSKEIDGEDDLVGKELRQGLREARRRAKTEKQSQKEIPLHVKETMLRKEVTHVDGSIGNDMDETKVYGDGQDCINTLTDSEMTTRRTNATMQKLFEQLSGFRYLLEDHESAKELVLKLQQECDTLKQNNQGKSDRISQLEEKVVDMTLNLAQCKGREDHHQMAIVKLKLELKAQKEDNLHLQEQLHDVKIHQAEALISRNASIDTSHQQRTRLSRGSGDLSQSLPSAAALSKLTNYVRRGDDIPRNDTLLNRSCKWVASRMNHPSVEHLDTTSEESTSEGDEAQTRDKAALDLVKESSARLSLIHQSEPLRCNLKNKVVSRSSLHRRASSFDAQGFKELGARESRSNKSIAPSSDVNITTKSRSFFEGVSSSIRQLQISKPQDDTVQDTWDEYVKTLAQRDTADNIRCFSCRNIGSNVVFSGMHDDDDASQETMHTSDLINACDDGSSISAMAYEIAYHDSSATSTNKQKAIISIPNAFAFY
eukprot:scaffold1022_cov196-Alexandrium_tamarense.AAC.17